MMEDRRAEKVILTGADIEAIYGLDQGTLANYRVQRKGCKFFKVGKKVVYRREDFEKWLFGNPVLTTDSIHQ